MVESLQFVLLIVSVSLCFLKIRIESLSSVEWIRGAARQRVVVCILTCSALLGCLIVAGVLHEPVPRIHDEFSYVLQAQTLASAHASSPSPPLPEFFETFHVLVRPVYASKYFPAQGLFLAIGERLPGHPAVGLWISSAAACGATCWMLQAWVGPAWGLLGGLLMVVQFGVYSYWSQTYWGGMVAALGGALFFGAIRRLWGRLSWADSLLGALGLVILANSRPLEGAIAALPVTALFLRRMWQQEKWKQTPFWRMVVIPAGAVLLLGVLATGTYNRAITGSALKPPYLLHEQQYQESPQFVFLPLRPKITYSSEWIRYYYEVPEMSLYLSQRTFTNLMIMGARKLMTWWAFYCGILLSVPLVLAGLLRRGWMRHAQIAVLAGFLVTAAVYTPRSAPPRFAIDLLAVAQVVLLWFVFDELWPRLAILTSVLVIFESLFVKYFFPHYFAPAACLVLYLQVEGLRRAWRSQSGKVLLQQHATRRERRQAARRGNVGSPEASVWRGMAIWLPLACAVSLFVRIEARINGWNEDPHSPDRGTLLLIDWSLRRAEMERWLEQQPGNQLVFVRYYPSHSVNREWVYNHPDLVHAKVVWARDLGVEHDRLLLKEMPDRKVWMLEADAREPQMAAYSESTVPAATPPAQRQPNADDDRPDL